VGGRKTLQNFPCSETKGYPEKAHFKNDYVRHAIAVSDWFEGFERQETKRLSDAEFAQMNLPKTDETKQRRAYYEGYCQAKMEVLGEA
jgi:hypothetical protein